MKNTTEVEVVIEKVQNEFKQHQSNVLRHNAKKDLSKEVHANNDQNEKEQNGPQNSLLYAKGYKTQKLGFRFAWVTFNVLDLKSNWVVDTITPFGEWRKKGLEMLGTLQEGLDLGQAFKTVNVFHDVAI